MNEIKETFEKIRVRIQAVMDLIVFYIGFLGPFVNRSSAGSDPDPSVLLWLSAFAIFLVSLRCFSFRFWDVLFFVLSLMVLLTFDEWERRLIDFLIELGGRA
jgi:hypothetical protein